MAESVSGDRIGNYQVERVLERDGRCLAYEAVHLVLPRRAVLKVVDAEVTDPEAAALLREAYILESLQHPGVVRVYESGLLADRRPWSAREHVEGVTLEEALQHRRAPAELREASGWGPHGPGPWGGAQPRGIDRVDGVALLRDLAGVLEHAHERGVLHRGLRPSRVLLTGPARGFPLCLADWSSARPHDAAPEPYAVSPGARPYAAPELVAGAPIDERTDVFALGVVGYRMLTGALPYEDRAVPAAPDGATFHVPTALRCPDAPPELAALIDRMLAHAPAGRPRSAEAHEALAWIAEAVARAAQVTPRIRRPRWTPPLSFEDRPEPLDQRVPVEPMRFGDGLD